MYQMHGNYIDRTTTTATTTTGMFDATLVHFSLFTQSTNIGCLGQKESQSPPD
jgi:hypothetical protein